MLANYGYRDGAGEFFITIDTGACDGCGLCVPACPGGVLEVGEDEHDPLRDEPVATVREEQRRRLQYACGGCKGARERPPLPCVAVCPRDAIRHSW
ncbi:MAG: 4Fe-4S dicluster domain-containing protein [Deltaproteobacteria bacterium]|nr:4Fe-4S dicluster domain-containing protein [Deltaproteobacteria bacterium]